MLTGVITGSEPRIARNLDLISMGLYGENHIGSEENLVWITKSHYPFKPNSAGTPFRANKQLCIFRNPVDSVYSFA
jgi:hypothetical protein